MDTDEFIRRNVRQARFFLAQADDALRCAVHAAHEQHLQWLELDAADRQKTPLHWDATNMAVHRKILHDALAEFDGFEAP